MPDLGQQLARDYFVARRDLDRTGLSMGIRRIPIGGLDDDKVAGQRPEVRSLFDVESPGILEKHGDISGDVDGIALGPAILGPDEQEKIGWPQPKQSCNRTPKTR